MRIWLAVGLATLAFVLMHGISVLRLAPFLTIYIAGLLFSALFLWRRSLVPGVCLHTLTWRRSVLRYRVGSTGHESATSAEAGPW
jgi:membrane protease YdiL (CAAX protease family)